MEISTAADFERKAFERRAAAAEPLTLPSGLKIMAYRPSPEWWLRHLGRMPQSMAIRVAGASDSARVTGQDLLAFANWAARLMSEMIVAPRVALNPGPGEVDPSDVGDDDLQYLIQFAGGEIEADGQGLDTFSRQSGTDADAGADRTAVE